MPILLRGSGRVALATMAGLPESVVSELRRADDADEKTRRWRVSFMMSSRDAAKSKFQRSVEKYVDDRDKKRNFLTMVGSVFDAIRSDDYQATLDGGPVACKIAKTFKYASHNHHVWEFKYSNKDRLYFVPDTRHGNKTLIFLMAFHKKDARTPDEVDPCIADAKLILADTGRFEYC